MTNKFTIKINKKIFETIPLYLFFCSIFLFPVNFQIERSIFLFIIILFSLFLINKKSLSWNFNKIFLFIAYINIVVIYYFIGELNSNPGCTSLIITLLFYTIIFIYLTILLEIKSIIIYYKISLYCTLFTNLLIILLFLDYFYFNNLSTLRSFFNIDIGIVGFIPKISTAITPLTFFVFMCALYDNAFNKTKTKKPLLYVVLISSILHFLILGRSSVILMFLVIPLFLPLNYLVWNTTKAANLKICFHFISRYFLFIVCLNISLFCIFHNLYLEAFRLFTEKLFATNDNSSVGYYRISSLNHAFHLFLESPLLGHGLGPKLLPSGDWQIEFTLLIFLCSFGIIPFTFFLFLWVFSILYLKKYSFLYRNFFELFCFASIIYYILSCTNPFLLNFDYLWILIWPLALVFNFKTNYEKP